MLTEAQNRTLTQVGPGTPMGRLLRRYWLPIAAVSELEERPVKPVRLLGEDLVLYRDLGGRYGLVDRHCPHRRADLSYGFVEECGIRCNYHGWLFAEDGRCLEQPYDDVALPEARFRDKVRIGSYPVEAKAGLLWAYLGPQPQPLVPTWEPFTWKNGFVQIVFSEIPCNWLQCQENSIDPVHFEWMHKNWSVRLEGERGPYAERHLKLGFDAFDYGFVYRRILENTDEEHALWTTGRVCLWPNCLFTGNHFEWRVPIDDERTLSVTWHFSRVPKGREPYVQERIPAWYGPVTDPVTGHYITSHIMNQDFIAWIGQGTIADRTKEHLGASDRGITLIRKQFWDDLERVERGEDPLGIVRDPARNACIELPVFGREALVDGRSVEEMWKDPVDGLSGYRYQAGQPIAVWHAFQEAMGLREREPSLS